MINLSKSLCPSNFEEVKFTPKILPTLFDCECPEEEPFLIQSIHNLELCPCPVEEPRRLITTTTERRQRPRNCFENYIKQIATVKFCSPLGPRCE
jgi:hypothetical protein